MKRHSHAFSVAMFAALAVVASCPVKADDTEIFIAAPSVAPRPNVLLIIDTSLSMDTQLTIRPDYDPDQTYSYTGCDPDRIYWKAPSTRGTTTPPACSTNQWISASNMVCKTAMDVLRTSGSVTKSNVGQWKDSSGTDNDIWTTLAGGRNSYVECKSDLDIDHGLADGDRKVPANRSAGPFSTNRSKVVDWNSSSLDDTYIFYTGNYLAWYHGTPPTVNASRLQIVKDAAKDLINSDSLNGTNVALMQFNSKRYNNASVSIPSGASDHYRGGMVIYPFTPIENARTALRNAIDGLRAESYTPLSETLYEAYLYYSGGNVRFGLDSEPVTSHADSRNGNVYKSPITTACQQNFIVFLTDGGPTEDMEAEPAIEQLIGRQCANNNAHVGVDSSENGDGQCLDELAGYMFNRDFFGTPATDQPKESVKTFMIGFGDAIPEASQKLLEDTAAAGGGQAFSATDPVSLKEAFENIASNFVQDQVTFTAPTVSVNAFNRTRNLNDLFFTVFEPARGYHWPGNLKKYRIDVNGVIRDANNDPAVEDGFFASTSQSFWSDSVDGRAIGQGGFAHEIDPPNTRTVYTDVGFFATPAISGADSLTHASNAFATGNTRITLSTLGVPSSGDATTDAALLTDAINWARGMDVDDIDGDGNRTEARFEMGDPLHARPVSVIYGGSATSPEAVVYAATNDGYLHAIDPNASANGADELWSFIPSELLPRLHELRTVQSSPVKRYGLDGNLVAFKIDVDNDGRIEPSDGDRVYLFFGMGRGGSNYYALDVTNKTSPKLLWRRGSDDPGLTGMGETWSTPVVTYVSIRPSANAAPVKRLVVIVGGGYDPAQDGGTDAARHADYRTDAAGTGIYMLDALTGDLLWRAGPASGADFVNANMTNAFPSEIRVLDMNNDSLADRMYAADVGGRIWRFDIINGNERSSLVRGGIFAALGVPLGTTSSTDQENARRFYTSPDVSVLTDQNNTFYLNIAIGSGFRGHPLNRSINDRFYSLRDPVPFRPMTAAEYAAMTPITDDDSATTPDLVDVTNTGTPTIPTTAKGWKINLAQGEKVLSDSITFGGAILFSTFTPASSQAVSACTARTGTNRFYSVRSLDGRAFRDADADGEYETTDRFTDLDQSGIAPAPVMLFPTPDPNCVSQECSPPPVCLVGPESCGVPFTNDPVKTFWMQKDID